MVNSRKFIYKTPFVGEPKESDFELVEEELPELKENEILLEAAYLSVDPYMRKYMARYEPGVTMIGGQVAKIIASKHTDYPTGSYMYGSFGWRTHTILNPAANDYAQWYLLPDFGGLPVSLGVGYLCRVGNTAYFGLLELCQPKAGETVVVTGAAGAVGSLVGQIAKLKGCRVVGFAGSDEKCRWLEEELGYDKAINYKKGDMKAALKAAAPKGVDCYFDNVGGELSSVIINQMNLFGRIAVCGAVSSYNLEAEDWPKVPLLQPDFVGKQLRMEGFLVDRWRNRWMEGIEANLKWIQEGRVKYYETITDGFENLPRALIEMLRGANSGKAIVKV